MKNPTANEDPTWIHIQTLLENKIPVAWLTKPISNRMAQDKPGWATMLALLRARCMENYDLKKPLRDHILALLAKAPPMHEKEKQSYWGRILTLLEMPLPIEYLEDSIKEHLKQPQYYPSWEIVLQLWQRKIPRDLLDETWFDKVLEQVIISTEVLKTDAALISFVQESSSILLSFIEVNNARVVISAYINKFPVYDRETNAHYATFFNVAKYKGYLEQDIQNKLERYLLMMNVIVTEKLDEFKLTKQTLADLATAITNSQWNTSGEYKQTLFKRFAAYIDKDPKLIASIVSTQAEAFKLSDEQLCYELAAETSTLGFALNQVYYYHRVLLRCINNDRQEYPVYKYISFLRLFLDIVAMIYEKKSICR